MRNIRELSIGSFVNFFQPNDDKDGKFPSNFP